MPRCPGGASSAPQCLQSSGPGQSRLLLAGMKAGAGEGRSSPRKAAVSRYKNFLALRDAPDKQLPDTGVGSQVLGRQQRLVRVS